MKSPPGKNKRYMSERQIGLKIHDLKDLKKAMGLLKVINSDPEVQGMIDRPGKFKEISGYPFFTGNSFAKETK